MFAPIARRLLASEVFDQLRGRIVRGEMAPGETLPAERSLASLLGVNRNAVREGLKRLQQAGLVAIQQGGATRVLDFRRTAGLELLGAMAIGPNGEVDLRIVRGIVELRTALAPIVGALAAERATKAHVRSLEEALARMEEANGDTAALAPAALDFWSVVVAATDNLALELAFNSLAASYGSVLDILHPAMANELRAAADYASLVRAVADGDREVAGQCATRIVARGEATFRALAGKLERPRRSKKGRAE